MSDSQDPFDFSRYTGPDTSPRGDGAFPPASPAGPAGHTLDFGPAGAEGWGSGASLALTAARPPLGWVAAAGALSAAGLVLAALSGGQVGVAIVAWALCGPVAIGLLAVFTLRDTAARARPLYTAPSWAATAYWAALGLSLVGVLVSALRIADWVGRL